MAITVTLPEVPFLERRAPCVAHRGASDVAPENTLVAVRAGITAGADLVEVDVRRTRDRATSRGSTPARGSPRRTPASPCPRWKASSTRYAAPGRAAAGAQGPRRSARRRRRAASELRYRGRRPDAPYVVVQSFDHGAMEALKAYEPGFDVGLIGKPRRAQLRRLSSWASAVNPHHYSVDAEYVGAVRSSRLRCLVWTPNTVRAMRRALGLGVDGLITDRSRQLQPAPARA